VDAEEIVGVLARAMKADHDERHPVGKRVLLQSGLMARCVTLHPRVARGLRNLLLPRLLRVPRVRDEVVGSLAGTTLRYAHRAGESALVGTRATQIPLLQERLTELQREPGSVLIRESGRSPADVIDVHQAERSDSGPAVLVRPDGYIARPATRPTGPNGLRYLPAGSDIRAPSHPL